LIAKTLPEKHYIAQGFRIPGPYPFLVEMKRLRNLCDRGQRSKVEVAFIPCPCQHKYSMDIGSVAGEDDSRLAPGKEDIEDLLALQYYVRYG